MLRHYDEIGLLTPKSTDPATGYRHYCESQLPEAGRIASLRDMGFGLTAIGEILRAYHDPKALAGFLTVRQAEVRAQKEEAERRLLLLETAIERLRKDETAMNYNVTLKTIPHRTVASVRGMIPSYDQEGSLWSTLYSETAPLGMQEADHSLGLAIFHDKGYQESNVDVEIQIAIKGTYPDTEHVKFKTVPDTEAACATYRGSYSQLTEVNHAVANWVRDNGYEFDGPAFCIYHVSPAQTKNPEELVTEVCYPVKKNRP